MNLFKVEYPKRSKKEKSPERELDVNEQLEIVKQVLPNADPSYLLLKVNELIKDPEALKMFIANAIENPNYPTMKDYLRYNAKVC